MPSHLVDTSASWPTSYTLFVGLAFVAAYLVKRREERRLGYAREAGFRWVGASALLGAVIGSKLGMLLYLGPAGFAEMLVRGGPFDVHGKTILGALAGGWVGVELAKRWLGITHSTGDAFALALPVGQAIGRVGCFFSGCCYGAPFEGSWAVSAAGASRHPVQLYESVLLLGIAGVLWALRRTPRSEGLLFRYFVTAYALVRFALDPLRGDTRVMLGPLSLPQLACVALACAAGLGAIRIGARATASPNEPRERES